MIFYDQGFDSTLESDGKYKCIIYTKLPVFMQELFVYSATETSTVWGVFEVPVSLPLVGHMSSNERYTLGASEHHLPASSKVIIFVSKTQVLKIILIIWCTISARLAGCYI